MTHIPDMPDDRAISLLAIDQYFRELHWAERLSQEDEAMYLRHVVCGYNERFKPVPNQCLVSLADDARECLVISFQGLVLHFVRRFQPLFVHFQLMDLVQEGNIGLLVAFDKYASSPDVPFVTVASQCIRRALWEARYAGDSEFALSCDARSLLSQTFIAVARFARQHGYEPSAEELAAIVGISVQQADKMLECSHCFSFSSLQEHLEIEGDEVDRGDFTSVFTVPDPVCGCVEEALKQVLEQAVNTSLSSVQKNMIYLRYGLDEEHPFFSTSKEIADMLGVGPSAVDNTCHTALENLRMALKLCTSAGGSVCELVPLYQDHYYTVDEAASKLHVSKSCLRKYIGRGLLPTVLRKLVTNGNMGYVIPKQAFDDFVVQGEKEKISSAGDEYYTLQEAADYLGIGYTTVHSYLKQGRLPFEMRRGSHGKVYVILKRGVKDFAVAFGSLEQEVTA